MFKCFHGIACYFQGCAVRGFVVGEGLHLALSPLQCLPSQHAPFVLCSSSVLGLGVAFLPFAGVGLLGSLGVHLILGVIFHESFATRKG